MDYRNYSENRKTLSPRMTDIAQQFLQGNTSAKGVGAVLGISPRTVKAISAILYARLGVHSAVELIVKHRDGLISIPEQPEQSASGVQP